jgi:hypothetical protein
MFGYAAEEITSAISVSELNLAFNILAEFDNTWNFTHYVTVQTGRSWVRFPMVLLDFFIDIILPVAL